MEELRSKYRRVYVLVWFILLCVCFCYRGDGLVNVGAGNQSVPALLVFGDSIVDSGSNNNLKTPAKCNFPPYGRDFLPSLTPTGRFSNGKLPTDFIVAELGIKDTIPSYKDPTLQPSDLLTGVSFASGGSGYDPLTSNLLNVISLSEQVQQFKEYIGKLKVNFGEEKTNLILSKSVILVVASSNDIVNTYFGSGIRKLQYDISSYVDLLIQHASSFIQEIYGLGGRKIGVFSAPPLGCLPIQRTLPGGIERKCNEEINKASKLFNAKLSARLESLSQNDLPQAKLVYIDVYNPLLHIIQNPTTYGFKIVDKGCCGTGTVEASILCNQLEKSCTDDSIYVFWDSFHPTEKTYRIIASKLIHRHLGQFF